MKRTLTLVTWLAVLACGPAAPALGETQALPGPLAKVGFDQRLGESLPLDLVLVDELGRQVRLGEIFGDRPVVLAFVYYDCPMLCPMVLNGLTSALKALRFDAGREFDVLVVSFDSREGPQEARRAKQSVVQRYGRSGTEGGWHFLTGDDRAIKRLTTSAGFRFVYLPEDDQFAHAAGVIAVTPSGKIARYFYGVEYAPRDLRLGLIESADHRIGSLADQVLLYCYHYDPETGTYSAVAMNMVRLGAAATVLILALFLLNQWRRERRQPAGVGV